MASFCDRHVKVAACMTILGLALFALCQNQIDIVHPLQSLSVSAKEGDAWRRLSAEQATFGGPGTEFGGGQSSGKRYKPFDDSTEHGTSILDVIGSIVWGSVFKVIVCIPVVWLYYSRVTKYRQPWTPRESQSSSNSADFSVKCQGCCEDGDYFAAGCCCLLLRAADTVHAVGVWSFWPFVGVYLGVQTVGSVVDIFFPGVGMLLSWTAQAGIFAVSRAKVRGALGLSTNVTPYDAAVWCFCCWCAAIQEAREVDRATDTELVFCCRMAKVGQGGSILVGEAVGLE